MRGKLTHIQTLAVLVLLDTLITKQNQVGQGCGWSECDLYVICDQYVISGTGSDRHQWSEEERCQ